MMMREGVSYADWRLMAPFQRKDYLARRTLEKQALLKRVEGTKDPGQVVSLIVAKVLGL